MKFSYSLLQSFFKKKLPEPEKLAEILTMKSFEVENIEKNREDFLLNIDILPNRAQDCLSYLGMVKEISAVLNISTKNNNIIEKISQKTPQKTKKSSKDKIENFVKITVKEAAKPYCRRYISKVLQNIAVKESPKWIKEFLKLAGQKPINNIVDSANLTMLLFGQPLHAFDLDKINGSAKYPKEIIIRQAKKGEEFTTLDNRLFLLDENILLISDQKDPLALAGIKGGKKTEITKNTKNIVLESANFNRASIRKTSAMLGLKTDSSARFSAGIDPNLAKTAINFLSKLILKTSKGNLAKGEIDYYPIKEILKHISFSAKEASEYLGADLGDNQIIKILNSLGIATKKLPSRRIKIVSLAKKLVGKPYFFGASSSQDAPKKFDCSSFVKYLFRQIGIEIPRISIDQFLFGKKIDKKKLKAGDLVFCRGKKWHTKKEVPKGIGHVGMYIGNGKIIHASYEAGKIIIEHLDKSEKFISKQQWRGAKRIITEENNVILATPPTIRQDLTEKQDIFEEIGRIYGYENLPKTAPYGILAPPRQNKEKIIQNKIKDILSGLGFFETLNYSFANSSEIKSIEAINNIAPKLSENLAYLANPSSSDKDVMRPNLILGILKTILFNLKITEKIKIFEIGNVFKMFSQNIFEKKIVSGAITSKRLTKSEFSAKEFYELKNAVEIMLEKLGIKDIWFDNFEQSSQNSASFFWHKNRSAEIKTNSEKIGYIGELNPKIAQEYGFEGKVALFEIDFMKLVQEISEEQEYLPISKFPSVMRDLSVVASAQTKMTDITNVIEREGGALLSDVDLFDIYQGDNLPEGKKSLAFRLEFQSLEKTLSDTEINALMDKIIQALKTSGLDIRR